ncbi:hypothetical protein [Streptomyces sp. NPDC086777]|uniref:hypothetical protein n=1 Tax=Streptomyces sp. NPDC086777 TaxID=3154866 RepID=UPI00344D8342
MCDDGSYVGEDEPLPPVTDRYDDKMQAVVSTFTIDASFVMGCKYCEDQRSMPATFEVSVLANGHWRAHMKVAPETGVHGVAVNRWLVGLNPGYLYFDGRRYQIEYCSDQMDGSHGGFENTVYGVDGVSPPDAPCPANPSGSPGNWWRMLFRRGNS